MWYTKCPRDNPAEVQFCQECGVRLELICPACATNAYYVIYRQIARIRQSCAQKQVCAIYDCCVANFSRYGIIKMAGRLEGKVALITGAASGIGQATALVVRYRPPQCPSTEEAWRDSGWRTGQENREVAIGC